MGLERTLICLSPVYYQAIVNLCLNPRQESISFSNRVDSLDSCPGLYTELVRHDWIQGTRQNYDAGTTDAVM